MKKKEKLQKEQEKLKKKKLRRHKRECLQETTTINAFRVVIIYSTIVFIQKLFSFVLSLSLNFHAR